MGLNMSFYYALTDNAKDRAAGRNNIGSTHFIVFVPFSSRPHRKWWQCAREKYVFVQVSYRRVTNWLDWTFPNQALMNGLNWTRCLQSLWHLSQVFLCPNIPTFFFVFVYTTSCQSFKLEFQLGERTYYVYTVQMLCSAHHPCQSGMLLCSL